MLVRIEVELDKSPQKKHKDQMHQSAEFLTDNHKSIVISQKSDKTLIAEFTMIKARQIDVVDKIGDAFSEYIEDYSDSSLSFPEKSKRN